MRAPAVAVGLAALALAGCGSGGSSSAVAPTASGATTRSAAPPPPVHASRSDPVIAAAGDIACPPGGRVTAGECHQATTALVLSRLRPTAVLPIGDDQYETGALDAFRAAYAPTWGRFNAIVRPVPGNHEYAGDKARGLLRVLRRPRRGPGRAGYYSYDLGRWHLIALNSNCSIVSAARPAPHRCGGCAPTSRRTGRAARSPTGTTPASPPACTATTRRWRRCGARSTTPVPTSSSTATTTTTSASGRRLRRGRRRCPPRDPRVRRRHRRPEPLPDRGPAREQPAAQHRDVRRAGADAASRRLQLALRARGGRPLHGQRRRRLPLDDATGRRLPRVRVGAMDYDHAHLRAGRTRRDAHLRPSRAAQRHQPRDGRGAPSRVAALPRR